MRQLPAHAHDRADRLEEPAVDLGERVHLVDTHAIGQGPRNGKYAQRGCVLELVPQVAELIRLGIQPVHADVEHA